MVGARNVLQFLTQWIHGIVHSEALAWVLMILVDYGLTCKFRHTHDAIGVVHTVLLYRVNCRVHLSTRAVEVGSVNVYAERLSADTLSVNASRICEPVMGMDDVKLLGASHNTCYDRVVVDFLVKV